MRGIKRKLIRKSIYGDKNFRDRQHFIYKETKVIISDEIRRKCQRVKKWVKSLRKKETNYVNK